MLKKLMNVFRSQYVWIAIVSFLWSLVICRTATPIDFLRETHIDSEMWITMARRFLDGSVLYRDIWDSKGPWIFLINALGIWLNPRYGLFVVEWIHFAITMVFSFKILSLYLDSRKAFLIGCVWPLLCPFFFIEYSNTCSAYCVPWISAAVYGMCLWVNQKNHDTHSYYWAFVYGLAVGCCFMTRPSNAVGVLAGVFFIFVVLLCYRQFKVAFLNLFFGTLGICVFCLPFFVYAFINDIVDDMLYATFTYNFKYATMVSSDIDVNTIGFTLICFIYAFFGSCVVITNAVVKHDMFPMLYVFVFAVSTWYLSGSAMFIHYFVVFLPFLLFFVCIMLNSLKKSYFVFSLAVSYGFGVIFMFAYSVDGYRPYVSELNPVIGEYIPLSGELLIVNRSYTDITYLTRPNLPRTRWILFQDFVGGIDPSLKDEILRDFCEFEPEYVYWGNSGVWDIPISFDTSIFNTILNQDYELLYTSDTGDMVFKRRDIL